MGKSAANSKVRRQKVRQRRAEEGAVWLRTFRRIGWWPVAVTLAFAAIAVAVAFYGEKSLGYDVGQVITQSIPARVDFTVEDRAKTKQKKEEARANTPSYYRVDHEFIDGISAELGQLYQEARSAETSDAFKAIAAQNNWEYARSAYEYLHPRGDDAGAEAYKSWVEKLRRDLTQEYTAYPAAQNEREPPSSTSHIMVLNPELPPAEGGPPGPPIRVNIVNVNQIANAKNLEGRAGVLAEAFPEAMRKTVAAILTRALQEKPILNYDQATTLDAMKQAEESVKPAIVAYEKGKPFVLARRDEDGRDVALTDKDLRLLKLEQREYEAFLDTSDPKAREIRKKTYDNLKLLGLAPEYKDFAEFLAKDEVEARRLREEEYLAEAGTAVLFVMIAAALFGYVGHCQPRILQVRTRTVGFAALLLAALLAVRLMDMHPTLGYLIPVPVLMASSIISLAYDRRFAVGSMTVLALMVVLTIHETVPTLVTLVAGITIISVMLDDVRTRTQIITAGFATGAVMFIVEFAFGLVGAQEFEFSVQAAAWAGTSAVLAATLIHAILPYIERAFKIATSLTLLEWRDANKPLQQLLVREAPGTYNHSLVLGTMAQAAAETIGANGLLAQVGALYHDIGKINQSEYFAENQEASINRHDRLEPRMSLLVILSHVKNGLALASEYGLPRVLHQFIAEHHGTTVVKYFHHAASEKQPKIASGRHDREVSDTEFRYEGPKPRSKESAILMLCDGVEGAVRAMHEPTAGRIESVVHSVLMDRLQDGQFDDCDITLTQLHRVEESLVKSLCRFYHGRVAYPKADKPGPADSEPKEPDAPAAAEARKGDAGPAAGGEEEAADAKRSGGAEPESQPGTQRGDMPARPSTRAG